MGPEHEPDAKFVNKFYDIDKVIISTVRYMVLELVLLLLARVPL